MAQEVVKALISHIEDTMKLKVERLHTLKNEPKIVSSYEELDKELQKWYLERNIKRSSEETSEEAKKKVRVSMMKATEQKEQLRYEDKSKDKVARLEAKVMRANEEKTKRYGSLTNSETRF